MSVNSDILKSLKPAAYNPRKAWAKQKGAAFKKSLKIYGDLSGIIFNRKTGQLVGGHKRVDDFRSANKVTIEKKPCKKDKQGTIAFGHVIADGNRFAYREVEWDIKKEREANLAANQWSAEFDTDALTTALAEMDAAQRLVLGFDETDLKALDISLEPEPAIEEVAPRINESKKLQKKWGTKQGQTWKLGNHRLVCNDSRDRNQLEKLMGGGAN